MKNIFGLDLGTTSIGWAVVNEAENDNEQSALIALGERVNPLSTDERTNFEKGKSITTNSDRNLKHGARLNLFRYKIRRNNLLSLLRDNGIINDSSILAENGEHTTFETHKLRAKAATERIELTEFARVLLSINKKRGYKSSRKADSAEEGKAIDGMSIAKELYENDLTPGQYVYARLLQNKKYVPDFYRSDLNAEFNRIYARQSTYYPDVLTPGLAEQLNGRNEKATWAIIAGAFNIKGAKRATKGFDKKVEDYKWRVDALVDKLDPEQIASVLSKINRDISGSSGYLGAIGDRSKSLYFSGLTVGQYQYECLAKNPHHSLKNEVFYRQDYLDEFERIWSVQASHHDKLTEKLKSEVRDIIIFYQRRLKSQKGSVAICELEQYSVDVTVDGKTKRKIVGPKVSPKSSPVFQEAKILQILNNVKVTNRNDDTERPLSGDEKSALFRELNWCDKMSATEALKLISLNPRIYSINYKQLEGNTTNASLLKSFMSVVDVTGHDSEAIEELPASKKAEIVEEIFKSQGFNTDIFHFDSSVENQAIEHQPAYMLWHLIYSYEGDDSISGNEALIKKLCEKFNFDSESAAIIASVVFKADYGNLSTRALRKILPYLKQGMVYSDACDKVGYRHSKRSLTREEIDNRDYKSHLDQLPRNSLRNPVVEKILNQMINVVNSLIETYGRPDEIRIELARELKKSAKERADLISSINKATADNEKIRQLLINEFGIQRPSRNDVIRYRLYDELSTVGYHTLYSDTYIPREELFSKRFDIEHIIPQSRLFDDSFANKTIEARDINIEKGNATALDFVEAKYDSEYVKEYRNRVDKLLKEGKIGRGKYNKLLTKENDIPEDFINRDLRNTQYISRKALEILSEVAPEVTATSGSITERLREDWQLIDVLQELNWDKYDRQGLTETFVNRDGNTVRRIKDWTKRNDHRHHAVDAVAIAFTRAEYVHYLNNLNAQSDKGKEFYAIRERYLERDKHNNLRFRSPIPVKEFRAVVKDQLEKSFVSHKSKNKVVTKNVNATKCSGGVNRKVQLTPRGQLHNETVYGRIMQPVVREEKIGVAFDYDKIATVASAVERKALTRRLDMFNGDPKKAFTGKNSPAKNPVYIDDERKVELGTKVKTVTMECVYTIRKEISEDLKLDKVIDKGVKRILQQRLDEYGGDPKKAFTNLDANPIYLNKEKGITIKRVTITGPTEVEPLHSKRDHLGNEMRDADGRTIPTDFINTGNNHHIAIYRDASGNLQERVMSFFEATARACALPPLPVIDKDYRKCDGWEFLFTMKRNEYFVFPRYESVVDSSTGQEKLIKTFDPKAVDLLDRDNYAKISPNLFRVQKLASKYYVFRHHLETNVEEVKELRDITWKRIQTVKLMDDAVKVRIDNLGRIVAVGES